MQNIESAQAATLSAAAMTITAASNMDFDSLTDGTVLRVDPALIDDLSVGGNKRRKKTRSAGFVESIRTRGVLQSLSVRPSPSNPHRLELCAGYGRRDTALEVDIASVPVMVTHYSDKEALAVMAAENKERENVSIMDEADLAETYISLHDGNYADAAKELGYSEAKFRDRLQLKRCIESVQDHIADPDSPVIAGHGLVLSIFDEEMQAKTLAAILKDPQTYTVKYLKKSAGQRQLDLGKAKFDTSDCDACSFNTCRQLAFNICEEEDESDAKCSKSSCYAEKTNAWLKEVRMVELEERFGNVILWETKPESDRRTIDAKQVGVNQYKTGCMNCEKRCTVVDDRPFKWGDFETDQCIDTDCYSTLTKAENDKKKAKAKAKANAKPKTIEQSQQQTVESNTASTNPTDVNETAVEKEVEDAPIVSKSSKAITELYEQIHRATSAELIVDQPKFRLAVTLASLCNSTGYRIAGTDGSSTRYGFNEMVLHYYTLDLKQVQAEMLNAVVHMAQSGGCGGESGTALMIELLKQQEDRLEAVTQAWQPTEQILAGYNLGAIEVICKDSGFIDAFNGTSKEVSFDQLFKQKKPDVIKAILAFDFDWTHYAPTDYLNLA